MKKKFLYLFLTFICLISLVSCHKIAGNHLSFSYNDFDINSNIIIGNHYIKINESDNTYINVDKFKYENNQVKLILRGGNTYRYQLNIDEEYKNIEDHLYSFPLKSNNSVIYAVGYLINDNVYGILNVYKDTVGYLSGGGNLAEEEIDYSIYYKYDNKNDQFTTLYKADEAMIVAFSNDKVIYWKNKKIYSYDINNRIETYLVDDYSYDSGIQHQSRGIVGFNSNYCLFNFEKEKFNSTISYLFIYNFSTNEINQLTLQE